MRYALFSIVACQAICFGHLATIAAEAGRPAARRSPARWHIHESTNFRACCLSSLAEAERLAVRCEQLRNQLAGVWLGKQGLKPWTPRCQVVVYPTLVAYLNVVGREAAQTAGSALIETEGDAVVARQIDLRGDLPTEMHSALAHELTHVIVADRIDRGTIPPWADEGMAVLADHPEKQAGHLSDLRHGLRNRGTFRTGELIALDGYPQPQRMGVFYGQSGSLVSFLVQRGNPQQFIRFLEIALETGYDKALKEVYQIRGIGQLEQLWLKSIQRGEAQFAGYVPGQIWKNGIAASEG